MSSLSLERHINLQLPTVALAEQMIAPVGKRGGPSHGDGWCVPSDERLRLARQLDLHGIGCARDGPAACSLVAEARQTGRRDLPGGTGADSE